jgi:hypothetical protein
MSRLVDHERDSAAAAEVRAWLKEQSFGSLSPIDVELRREEDVSGDEAWFFVVVLPAPESESGTWPVSAMNDLTRAARDRALASGLSWPWHVAFRPETEEQQEDEDDQLQISPE